MKIPRPTPSEAAIALVCGVVAVVFLAGEGLPLVLLAALVPFAVLPYRRLPLLAAVAVAGLFFVEAALGGSPDSPWPLPAFFIVSYGLGRYGGWLATGLGYAAYLPIFAAPSDTRVGNVLFATFLFGMCWTFGRLVRRRSAEADVAASTASELASTDPRLAAARAVAEERARLAGDTLAVIRGAVLRMREASSAAAADLDPAGVEVIQAEGRRATRELRRLLGLLRAESGEEQEVGEAPRAARRWRADLLAFGAVAALLAVDLSHLVTEGGVGWPGIALGVLFAATVLLRRVDPAAACLVAILPLATGLAFDILFPHGVGLALVGVLLVWSVTAREDVRPRDYLVLTVFVGVFLLDTYRFEPLNVGMASAILAVGAVAGHLWATHGRQARTASTIAEKIRAEHEDLADRAVRTERLRLARELHDVTSHSVGVMVLQAGAATALRERAPDQARAALRNVEEAAVRALSELEVLFGLLDAGAVGTAGHAAVVGHDDLTADLAALAARLRQTGLRIALDISGPLPDDPVLARTVYRVVQEALTNAARHAPQSAADVVVAVTDDVLEVIVRNDGSAEPSAETGLGSGFGLVGLDERIRAHGGDLEVGPRPEGGFEVSARIPLARAAEVSS